MSLLAAFPLGATALPLLVRCLPSMVGKELSYWATLALLEMLWLLAPEIIRLYSPA